MAQHIPRDAFNTKRIMTRSLVNPSVPRQILDLSELDVCKDVMTSRRLCSNAILGTHGYDCRRYCVDQERFEDDAAYNDPLIRSIVSARRGQLQLTSEATDELARYLEWRYLMIAAASKMTPQDFVEFAMAGIDLVPDSAIPHQRIIQAIVDTALDIGAESAQSVLNEMRRIAISREPIDNTLLQLVLAASPVSI